MLFKPVQLANAPVVYVPPESPTATTLVGIVTDAMPGQLENAAFNTLVTVVEMTMSPLQHAPPCEDLSTQPVVTTSSDILLAEATATADAAPLSCSNLPICEDEEGAETDEAEVTITAKEQTKRKMWQRKRPARPFRGGLLKVRPLYWWRC
jgi:hypothetical protein